MQESSNTNKAAPMVPDANRNEEGGYSCMSVIALNGIAEERAKEDAEYRHRLASSGKPLLSHARKLTEAELLGKLERVGIGLAKPSYAEIAEHALSAEEIFKTALTTEVRSRFKRPFDEDWVWLALTILWERWFPQWPNFEQLDERIRAGYALSQGDPCAACADWGEAWKDFLLLYDKGSFTSMEEFDEAFRGTQFVSNWTCDFEMELGNAAVSDPGWHERRAQFCEEFLGRFPGADNLMRENMRRALGEATFGQGDRTRGDALFEHWLTDDPRWGWGWIGWADCYSLLAKGTNRDLQRAEVLLRQGLETPTARDRADVLERLAEVCHEQGHVEEALKLQTESEAARRANAGRDEPKSSPVEPAAETVKMFTRPTPARSEKIGRNEPCPCGSGKKYKKCCLAKDEERARQAAAAQLLNQQQPHPGELSSNEDPSSGRAVEEDQNCPLLLEEPEVPAELKSKLDRLWTEFEAVPRPAAVQMDEFLSQLLSLASEAIEWSDVLHRFAGLNHPDLPEVFRRISVAVPHVKDSGMAFFYWAAAEEFTRQGAPHLLPEVAEGFGRLGLDSYDPDALTHLEDFLLAAGLEAETLQLAEHFLPIERADSELMAYAVPNRCSLIFELRIGQALREGPSGNASLDVLAKRLRSNIEDEIHEDSARRAAEVAAGAGSDAVWERSQFDLVTGDISRDEMARQNCLRLFATLIRIARETWRLEMRRPGCALRGLTLLLKSVYNWKEQHDRKSKKSSNNLLDYLRPAGLESRLVQSCREMIGVNVPRAHLLLQAHELLAHSAARYELITPGACAQTEKELSRLRHALSAAGS